MIFYLDRNLDIFQLNDLLKKNIDKLVQYQKLRHYNKYLSKKLNIPLDVIELEFKQFLFNNFDNKNGTFKKKFKEKKYLKNFFILIFFYLLKNFNIFNRTKISKDIIIDNISLTSYQKYLVILRKLKTSFITYKKKKFFPKNIVNKLYIQNIIFLNNQKIIFLTLSLIFKYFKSILDIDYKKKFNYSKFFFHVIYNKVKYENIFSHIDSKILVDDFYNTSVLKNYIFKKNGGKKTVAVQSNIFQLNGPGMYSHADIFLSLGKKSYCNLSKFFNANFDKIEPIGSLNMEYHYFNKKKKNKKYFDIVLVASNHTGLFHDINNQYLNDYLQHYLLLKDFADKNFNVSIAIKHKKKIYEDFLHEIFKNNKNVKIIFDKNNFINDTYDLCMNANFVCSWSSTLIYELIGANKDCYILDPKNNNFTFFQNKKMKKIITISNLKEFEFYYKISKNKKRNLNIKLNKSNYCNNSIQSSQNFCNVILKYL